MWGGRICTMTLRDYLNSNPNKTYLIFDFDETIFKLLIPWEECLIYVRKQLVSLDKSIYERYISEKIDLNHLQNEYISKFGKKAWDLIYQNNLKFETEYYAGVEINQDIVDFISSSNKYEMFIWSANTEKIIEKVLRKYKLFNKFKKIIGRDSVNLLKPNPEGFNKIYDSSIAKEKYVFIGDSSNDKLAAENVGIDLYLVDHFKIT